MSKKGFDMPSNKGVGKGKGKKRSNRGKPNTKKEELTSKEVLNDGEHHNDMSWWMKLGQLSNDVANFPWGTPIGAPSEPVEITNSHNNWGHKFTPAGILKLSYTPCFGDIDSRVHPINEAARIIYDFVNAKNSRNASYDPSDLMVYIIAMSGLYSLYTWTRRIVGLYASFNIYNKYWPTEVLNAMDITSIDTQHDIVTWRNLVNRMAIKLNMFCVPKQISYFNHIMGMNDAIYMDSTCTKASLMFFQPTAFWKYNPAGAEYDAASISLKPLAPAQGVSISPAWIESLFNDLILELLNDSDITRISTDILKAYGEENLLRLGAVSETFTVSPESNMEMMTRIHNATVFEGMAPSLHGGYEIFQDMDWNILKTSWEFHNYPAVAANLNFLAGFIVSNQLYDLPDMRVDPAIITNASILKALPIGTSSDRKVSCVCEVLTGTDIYKYEATADGPWEVVQYSAPSAVHVDSSNEPLANLRNKFKQISVYSKFKGAPMQYYYECINGTSGSPFTNLVQTRCLSDLENFNVVDNASIRQLHQSALLSIFYPVDIRPVG